MHQNRASPFASDFYRRRGYRREFRSEYHFYPFSSQKKSRFASDFLRRGNRASWGLKKSRDVFKLGSDKNCRRSRRDFGALSQGNEGQGNSKPLLGEPRFSEPGSFFWGGEEGLRFSVKFRWKPSLSHDSVEHIVLSECSTKP